MKNWKKAALGSATLAAAVIALAGCSAAKTSDNSKPIKASDAKGTVTLWVDTTEIAAYKPIVEKFEAKYPNVTVKMSQSPTGSANAKTDVTKDPSKAANVFELPHDQIGQMVQAGIISRLSPKNTQYVKDHDVEPAVNGVTYKGNMYAYPQQEQSKILFYNKSKLSAEDVKSWDTLTSKAVLAATITDTQNGAQYTMIPAFLSNGVRLYGANGESLKGSTFDSDKAKEVMAWIHKQKDNPGVLDASTAAIGDLKSGKADAYLDGPWDSTTIKAALGSNYAVAPYPSADFGSGKKPMQAFLGIKGFAVNSQTKKDNLVAANALAQYLTNKTTQETLFTKLGQIPVDKDAQKASNIANSDIAKATFEMAKRNTVMPKLPEMANFWNLAGPIIQGAYNGSIPASQYGPKLAAFNENISKSSN